MRGFNQCVFAGNAIAYSKTFEGKGKVVSFCIAVNRGKNKDGVDLGVDFLDIKVFGKAAEWTSVKKGEPVVVVGKLRKEKYKEVWQVSLVADQVWRINNNQAPASDSDSMPAFDMLVEKDDGDDLVVPSEDQADIPF